MKRVSRCPSCKSENYVCVSADSSDGHTYLYIYKFGSVRLRVCTDCGTVYLDAESLKRLREEEN